jgi:hypothetical protein
MCGFFHATNYTQVDVGQSRDAEVVIEALEAALFDELPKTRVAAAMPLAWMHHDQATDVLRGGYHQERDSEAKARILRNTVHLMSVVGEELLQDALQGDDTLVRQTAEYIMESRSTRGA